MMNVDLFDLERFVMAQDYFDSYNTALQEVKEGHKRSHWMWYVFPQIHGLGHSGMSRKYSIKSLLEAKAYLLTRLWGNACMTWYTHCLQIMTLKTFSAGLMP